MSTPNLIPPLDNLAAGGQLTSAQSANFLATMADDSKLNRPDLVMDEAKACLYWFQRPFASLLIRNPYLVKLVKPAGPSKWDRKADDAERRAAKRAEKAARAAEVGL